MIEVLPVPASSIDLADPVNRQHPQAVGLVDWWLALPGLDGGRSWWNLFARNYGTLTGMDALTGGFRGTTRPGGLGDVLFDGSDDHVAVVGPSNWQLSPITLCAWVLSTQASTNNPRVLSNDNPGATGIGFYLGRLDASGNAFYGIGAGGFRDSGYALTLNAWHHLAVTYDGVTARLYVDGTERDSYAAASLTYTPTNSLEIGASQGLEAGTFWYGRIDDVRIYNYAISATSLYGVHLNSMDGCPGLLNRIMPWFLHRPMQWPFNAAWAMNANNLIGCGVN